MTATASLREERLPTVDVGALQREGRLPAWIFNDELLYAAELRSIFARSWVYVGHESELRHPGDYWLRYIGQDPFVFVRDEHGDIRVLFDACRHRGTRICRVEKGNASHFRCPYHGWTYRNTGELIGVPLARQAFRELDKRRWSLSAARVDQVHGLVFASLDRDGPSLRECLGPMSWYLDIFFGLDSRGVTVLGEPHRWTVGCNWKLPAENLAGDDYHTLTLHKSIWEIEGLRLVGTKGHMSGYHVDAGNGHALTIAMPALEDDPEGLEYWGYPKELVKRFDFGSLSEEQRQIARRARTMGGTVFPNFSFLSTALTVDPAKSPEPFMTVRTWQPRGPSRTEIWSWLLGWRTASERARQRAYEIGMGTFSPGGILEQDDSEPWQTITETAGSQAVRALDLDFNYAMGLPGTGNAGPVDDWPGPGTAYSPRLDESGQRAFYRRWHEAIYSESCA